MRLINTRTYEFKEFHSTKLIKYAILSHVWRNDEILYSEFLRGSGRDKLGYLKLKNFCKAARAEKYDWVWIDTACIDKKSSAELSEAINSMYKWYQDCDICYVYLDDVDKFSDIEQSRWLTRGWTLQELIAPGEVIFFNASWKQLGKRFAFADQLSKWTGIEQIVLEGVPCVQDMSIATRMSWASQRNTTRIEDMAYCLLGLFNVNMPLLYGEGMHAFYRLQVEILKSSADHSILSFNRQDKSYKYHNKQRDVQILAHGPSAFAGLKIYSDLPSLGALELTKSGLRIGIDMVPFEAPPPSQYAITSRRYWGILSCRHEGDLGGRIAIPLRESLTAEGTIWSIGIWDENTIITEDQAAQAERKEIIVSLRAPAGHGESLKAFIRSICIVDYNHKHGLKLNLMHSDDNGTWNNETLTSEILYYPGDKVLRTLIFKYEKYDVCFLIRFIDSAYTSTSEVRRWAPGKEYAYLSYAVKPQKANLDSWVRQELLHDYRSMIGQNWHGSGLYRSPYQRWVPTRVPRFRCVIDMSSQEGNLKVIVRAHISNSKMSNDAVWKLMVETESVPSKRKRED